MVTLRKATRALSIIGFFCVLMSCTTKDDSEFKAQFMAYRALFIDGGRVIDTGNGDVSHSEGQGYGMLFAIAADDKETFDALWQWTKSKLMRRDGLFSWRYRPCADSSSSCIDDPNNASDGDILIAWALLRASEKWGVSGFKEDARNIVEAIENTLLVEYGEAVLLLPGEYGFSAKSGEITSIQLNMSYWVFPALSELSSLAPTPSKWNKLYETGLSLLSNMQFSSYRLPSDWVRLEPQNADIVNEQFKGKLTLENVISPEFGFNAVRIPLQLVWSEDVRNDNELAERLLAPYYEWWVLKPTPATVNLLTEQTAEYEMTDGMRAVKLAVDEVMNSKAAEWPTINRKMDYYSASLTLLSMLAVADNAS